MKLRRDTPDLEYSNEVLVLDEAMALVMPSAVSTLIVVMSFFEFSSQPGIIEVDVPEACDQRDGSPLLTNVPP